MKDYYYRHCLHWRNCVAVGGEVVTVVVAAVAVVGAVGGVDDQLTRLKDRWGGRPARLGGTWASSCPWAWSWT